MYLPSEKSADTHRNGGRVLLMLLAATAVILAMAASIFGVYPFGKPVGIGSFVALWFRELVLVVVFVAIGLFIVTARLRKHLRARTMRGKDAQTQLSKD